jgi:hypothetical protein
MTDPKGLEVQQFAGHVRRPHERAERIAAGLADLDDQAWIARGLKAWLSADGSVSLERCLRLPDSPKQLCMGRRDAALCAAAREIKAAGPWDGSQQLREELERYATRGGWLTWRDVGELPPGGSEIRRQLHQVLRFNGGVVLGARQIQRIAGHVWAEKCQAQTRTVDASNDPERRLNCITTWTSQR